MKASRSQIQDLANTIALQADALACGALPALLTDQECSSKAALILSNALTLREWTNAKEDD